MDIQVGDMITFKNKYKIIIFDNTMIDKWDNTEIAKIERIGTNGWHTVFEIKPSITNDEKQFIRSYLKCIDFENDIEFVMRKDSRHLFLGISDTDGFEVEIPITNFTHLEEGIKYSLEELEEN